MDNREFGKQWPKLGADDQRDRMANAIKKLIDQAGDYPGRYEDYFVPTPPGLGDNQEGGG